MRLQTSIWHTASPNYGDRDRENTIIAYRGAALGAPHVQSGEGNSPGKSAIPLAMLRQFDEAGLLRDTHKQLLGFAGAAASCT